MFTLRSGIVKKSAGLLLWMMGWKSVGHLPPSGCVVIGAPHTSNWDFVIGIPLLFSTGVKFHWMGKQSLFRAPWGFFFRMLGGVSVNRTVSGNQVAGAVRAFREDPKTVMVLAPEGTRKKVVRWRTGFYYIARGADVPVVLGFLNYAKREVGFGPSFFINGDFESDMKKIQAFYMERAAGKYPHKTSWAHGLRRNAVKAS